MPQLESDTEEVQNVQLQITIPFFGAVNGKVGDSIFLSQSKENPWFPCETDYLFHWYKICKI